MAPNDDLEKQKDKVKSQVKNYLVKKLKMNQIDSDRVSLIAKKVVEALKDVVSLDQLDQRLTNLEQEISELHELKEERFELQNMKDEQAIALIVSELIKHEEFQDALKYGRWSAETQEDHKILEELKKIYPELSS